jgi:hypothetical protein
VDRYEIPKEPVSDEFIECLEAAGFRLQRQAQGPIGWLKANLYSPFLEHLSFRLGNQMFFVRLEDSAGQLYVPSSRKLLTRVAQGCYGIACLMPMRKTSAGWSPEMPGWGLVELQTGKPVDPPALITDDRIEMTDWELHDFAVQVVRQALDDHGREITNWQSDPEIDPSIWFVGDSGFEWVVVRAARFPILSATPPSNWTKLAELCARLGRVGHFASVSVASPDDAFDLTGQSPATPLWRGHQLRVRYFGLEPGPTTPHRKTTYKPA